MTGTPSSVVMSEVRAAGANIKQQHAVNIKLVDEQLKRIRADYRKYDNVDIDFRDAARLILADLVEHDVDEALINEFTRTYIGG